jgi:hypothetical protein
MFPKSEPEWRAAASAYLKGRLREAAVTYRELARRLRKFGIAETERTITMKLSRGAFSATFLIACLAAIGAETIRIGDWRGQHHWKYAVTRRQGALAPDNDEPTSTPSDPTEQA